jgi:hypothetical protein
VPGSLDKKAKEDATFSLITDVIFLSLFCLTNTAQLKVDLRFQKILFELVELANNIS